MLWVEDEGWGQKRIQKNVEVVVRLVPSAENLVPQAASQNLSKGE
jgi:hypothetical protein